MCILQEGPRLNRPPIRYFFLYFFFHTIRVLALEIDVLEQETLFAFAIVFIVLYRLCCSVCVLCQCSSVLLTKYFRAGIYLLLLSVQLIKKIKKLQTKF